MADADDALRDYHRWKRLVPFLYDWFNNHHLDPWPSMTCRWGALTEQKTFKTTQRLYLSERTDPGDEAQNCLLVMEATVIKPRVASAESINSFNENTGSAFVKRLKVIPHPGEVNKMREVPKLPHLLVTHTDAPELYLWNMDRQPEVSATNTPAPDMVLTGHEAQAPFALGMAALSPSVASGGEDNLVLLWSLQDHVASLTEATAPLKEEQTMASRTPTPPWLRTGEGGIAAAEQAPALKPRVKFAGHTEAVEDVAFNPQHDHELCSVGDDKSLRFWDARKDAGAAITVLGAHKQDVHCVDWSPFDEHMVVTGSADAVVKLWDRRKMSSAASKAEALHVLRWHTKELKVVEWSPHHRGVLASAAADSRVNVWDTARIGEHQSVEDRKYGPPELLFQHAGHRSSVEDIHWNPHAEWALMSVSDDSTNEEANGGGTMQMWRINDLLTRPASEALAELEQHCAAASGGGGAKVAKPPPKKVVKTSKGSSVKDERPERAGALVTSSGVTPSGDTKPGAGMAPTSEGMVAGQGDAADAEAKAAEVAAGDAAMVEGN